MSLAIAGLGTPFLFWWVLRPPQYDERDAALAATLGGICLIITAAGQAGLVVAQRDHESAALAKQLTELATACTAAEAALEAATGCVQQRTTALRDAEGQLWSIPVSTSALNSASRDSALDTVAAKQELLDVARQTAADAHSDKLSIERTIEATTKEIKARKAGRLGRATPWAMLLFGTGLVILPDLATTLKGWR